MTELKLYFDFYDTIAPREVVITWGVHKELVNILSTGDNLFQLLNSSELQDKVIEIILSERDRYGKIIRPFEYTNLVTIDSMVLCLNQIFDYFENFFFLNQQRIMKTVEKMQEATKAQSPSIEQ